MNDRRLHRTPVTDGGASRDLGAERHHILRELRHQLERHPAVEAAWGTPEGEYSAVEAEIDPSYFGRVGERATLRIVWQPTPEVDQSDQRPDSDDPLISGPMTHFSALFRVHYSEPGGLDCGFHHEPNPHVNGWFHFQRRASPNEAYEYSEETLEARSPASALWEILDKFEYILRET